MPRFEARAKVLQKLKSLDLLREIKEHEMVLPICSRTGDVIEPLLKEQWFAKSSELFKICGDSVKDGRLKLIPEFRNNLWNHYVNAFKKDWCISRQLWWGQQIPAYKCWPKNEPNNFKWFAAHDKADALKKSSEHFNTEDLNIQQGALGVRLDKNFQIQRLRLNFFKTKKTMMFLTLGFHQLYFH